MTYYESLPIYKKALDLAVWMEQTVREFPRYHNGSELREKTRTITVLIARANVKRVWKTVLLEIRERLEELKILIRICKELKVFKSWKSCEYAVRQVVETVRQNEGWIKSQ